MGEEGVFHPVVKGELQDLHPGKAEAVAQGLHLGGDDPQVLGEDGDLAEDLLDLLEELLPRGLDPAPLHRRGAACGDLPVGLKAAEVVYAHQVEELQGLLQTADPEGEPLPLQNVPAVKGLPQRWPVSEK